MFKDSKYTKWYFDIIAKAKNQEIFGYTEKHHIIPKSLGGNNKKANLIRLSARQHYICHLLLMKMVISKKHQFQMASAFQYMAKIRNNSTKQRYNSKLYEYHRKIRMKIQSERFSGKGNPHYGIAQSEETKQKISQANSGQSRLPQKEREKRRQNWLTNNPNNDPAVKMKQKEKLSKRYIVIDPQGNKFDVFGLKDFAKKNNLHVGNLCLVANGKLKSSNGGWKCYHLD